MSQKADNHTKLTDTLALSEFKTGSSKGFCLYDETRGMNLAMRAESEREAFLDALEYYQKRLKEVEDSYNSLKGQVDGFVAQFVDDTPCEFCSSYK